LLNENEELKEELANEVTQIIKEMRIWKRSAPESIWIDEDGEIITDEDVSEDNNEQ
jgi:hypothetical protein